MTEPTLADVMASIAQLSVETRTRVDGLASESRSRDVAQTERSVRLEARMDASVGALSSGLMTLKADFATVKLTADQAKTRADTAVELHTAAESASQDHWRSIMGRLDKQDTDRDRIELEKKTELEIREASKKASREQESLAARRLNENRAHQEKMLQARTPALVAAISLVGVIVTLAGTYFTTKAAHVASDEKLGAQIGAQAQQLSTIRQKVETVTQAVAPSPPSPPPPLPSSASPAPLDQP